MLASAGAVAHGGVRRRHDEVQARLTFSDQKAFEESGVESAPRCLHFSKFAEVGGTTDELRSWKIGKLSRPNLTRGTREFGTFFLPFLPSPPFHVTHRTHLN